MSMTDSEILSATNTAVQAAGVLGAANTSRKERKWQEKMYAQQLADNEAIWMKQNEYNHPSAQMARLREAGLNPNLVYGKGADVTAQAISPATKPNWNAKSPDVSGLANSLFSGYDLSMKQAQVDNLRVQNTVLGQESELKKAQTLNTLAGTKLSEVQRSQMESLFPYTLEGKKLDLQGEVQRQKIELNQEERNVLSAQQSLTKGVEEILTLRANRANTVLERSRISEQIALLKKDNRIKELDAQMADSGRRPGDGWMETIVKQVLDYLQGDSKSLPEKVEEKVKDVKKHFSPSEWFKRQQY